MILQGIKRDAVDDDLLVCQELGDACVQFGDCILAYGVWCGPGGGLLLLFKVVVEKISKGRSHVVLVILGNRRINGNGKV